MSVKPFATGAAFGAALSAAAIHQPAVIIGQMNLQNWHMLTTFLTASGTSTLLVTVLQRLGYLNLKPRSWSSLGLLGPLDGNIVGGLLIGAGMALSGACPGTVFAQAGAGVRSSAYTLIGTALGGIAWSGFLRAAILRCRSRGQKKEKEKEKEKQGQADAGERALALDEWTGLNRVAVVVALETVFAGAVAAIVYLASPASDGGLVKPVEGGLLIAGAQAVSIALRRTLLGTSACFEEVGDYFWWIVGGGRAERPKSCSSVALTTGMVAGALAITSLASPPAGPAVPEVDIDPIRAVSGGVMLALGSRMAGGCTSGHGISGISLLSVSSFITVAAMFAGGMGLAALI
ncbi:hypothetical protein F4779DRAFT_479876 [Xylariaceae sp. FL0662B]|nr:hypothetical protein F4779DRAFT_479876 [Xylariaceae sp. FL0662B]